MCALGYICKSSVPVITVQVIVLSGRCAALMLELLKSRAIHQVQIHVPVVVVIKPTDAATIHLQNIVFLFVPGDDQSLNSCLTRYILESYARRVAPAKPE